MAAACYMAFGRVILWVVPREFQSARHLWLPAIRITPLFVGCDVLSFFVQIIGGAMLASANNPAEAEAGKNVVLVGLGIQIATFGFFVLASIRFAIVLRTKLRAVPLPTHPDWRLFLTVVNVASVFILVRTILRFVEYALGSSDYLSHHPWFFYFSDGLLVVLVAMVFIFVHPGQYLPYLGLRRKSLNFSDNGPFSNWVTGHGRAERLPDTCERPSEMSRMLAMLVEHGLCKLNVGHARVAQSSKYVWRLAHTLDEKNMIFLGYKFVFTIKSKAYNLQR